MQHVSHQASDETHQVYEALMGVTSSLAAAISLLERSPKVAAASDKMFDLMISDYKKSLETARGILKGD